MHLFLRIRFSLGQNWNFNSKYTRWTLAIPSPSYFNLYADLVTGVVFFEFTTLYFLLGSTGFLVAQNVIPRIEYMARFYVLLLSLDWINVSNYYYFQAVGWKQWNHSVQNCHVGCAFKTLHHIWTGKWNFASSKIENSFRPCPKRLVYLQRPNTFRFTKVQLICILLNGMKCQLPLKSTFLWCYR